MNTKEIYVVICQDRYTGIMVGHLPFCVIPRNSILWDALSQVGSFFEKVPYLVIDSLGALQGIYEDKSLAKEHMRIEYDWRGSDQMERTRFWINTIKSKKADNKDKYV